MANIILRKIKTLRSRIIRWYNESGDKNLPWRNTDDPWAILIAAFFLRKTTTAQVVKVYEKFLRKYPKPEDLLSADISEIRELIRPLGIEHQRAIHIKKIAEHIKSEFGGKIPCTRNELKKLPGVGDYIAAEVLLGACNKPEPLLDRNMIRIIERVFGIKSQKKRPHIDPKMWTFAKMLVPENPKEAKAFNYGILDLARKICTAKNPRCDKCPIKDLCVYLNKKQQSNAE